MKNAAMIQTQVEYLYHTSAKPLYNLALYAVGDKHLAEQMAQVAFSDAFKCIQDKSDVRRFEEHCFRFLYMHGKKVLRMSEYYIGSIADNSLTQLLNGLSFEERFVLLLFCWQKYSIHQISKMTRLPRIFIEKRLNAAVNKAIRIE